MGLTVRESRQAFEGLVEFHRRHLDWYLSISVLFLSEDSCQ